MGEVNRAENQAWADVFSKILKTGKRSSKKNLVLAKAKKDDEIERDKLKKIELEKKLKQRIEVIDEDGNITAIDNEKISKEENQLTSKRKSEDQSLLRRVKPSLKEKERETYLNSIATQGVVQLFNAVEKYQVKAASETAKVKSEKKKEKVISKLEETDFMDIISSSKSWLTDDTC